MKYKGQQIDVLTWTPGRPWPEAIAIDGVRMEYAERWESLGGKQIIYYKEPDKIRLHGVARLAFVEERS